ncbi:MAG: ATP-binding protein [Halioglobus sp.]|nr:ATP-binding protein [Halioglobus sp.]
MKGSLRSRLLAANLVLLPLFLGATGYYLERGFRLSLDSAADERLQVQLLALMAEADFDQELVMPAQLLEARYNQANSGLYAVITDGENNSRWVSSSAVELGVEKLSGLAGKLSSGERHFKRRDTLYHAAWSVIWQTDSTEVPLTFHVFESTLPAAAQLSSFRASLLLWLGGAAVALLAGQLLVMYWGLRPLQDVARDIAAIENGEVDRLGGAYPLEVSTLTYNLDSLLASEKQRRERTRNTLSDLAHSLKTPLSVIRSADPGDADYLEIVAEQTDLMEAIVGYQLQRASGGTHSLLRMVTIAPVVERLRDSMQKVYADKHMQFDLRVDSGARFRGDERDLMEILGNLMDNACKYGRSRVSVCVRRSGSGLFFAVEDDGRGIHPDLREAIRDRGARADSTPPGQGIGLAVTADILASYNAELSIHESELGGARIEVRVP